MLRIAVTGPESSGKTTLAGSIAEELNAKLIEEYSRIYLERQNGNYSETDLAIMAIGHHEQIKQCKAPIIVVDTDFIVFHVWSNYKFKRLANEIDQLISSNVFDLHILCKPDITWEHDPLRENPNDRDILFDLYIQALNQYGKNFIIVEGKHEQRLKKSIQAINIL